MSTNNCSPHDSNRGIMKSTSIISTGILSSRILGFIRDIVLAKMMGTAWRADAFFVALRIPNLFRDIVGEGASNSAIIPVASEYAQKDQKEEFWNFISVVFILALMILSAITILGMIFTPVIVRLIAPGFIDHPEKLDLTIRLTRIMFPYLVLIGLTAYSMGILYTFRSFLTPAFSPCLLNIAIILSAFWASKTMKEPTIGLAIGVLIGGAAQLLVQIGPLVKKGIKFTWPKDLRHPGAKKVGRLLAPRLFGTAVYELNIFIDTFCASLSFIVGPGAISAIYYANRIIQFPVGVVSTALASAILPAMSGFAVRNDIGQLKKTLIFSLKNIIFVMLPASVFTVILAAPIIRVLFQRGEFNMDSTAITSLALAFYGLGLVSYGGVKIMVTAFYALQDTKTPVRVATMCLIINTVLNFLLIWPLKVGGIALASAIAGTVNFLTLFFLMDKRLLDMKKEIGDYALKVFLATLFMGIAVASFWPILDSLNEALRLVVIVVLGTLVFLITSYFLKIDQINQVMRWISEKK